MTEPRPLTEPTVRVSLIGIPVELHRRASEHQEALRRELAFIDWSARPDAAPVRLQALAAELAGRFGRLTAAQHDQLTAAIESGTATLDLDYDLPATAADAAERLGAMLDEVDRFCADDALLSLVTPPPLLAYRQWFLAEFVDQVRDGRTPSPWTGPTGADGAVDVEPADGGTALVVVTDDLDFELAGGLRDELLDHVNDGVRTIAVDLSACGFIDSAGISLLISTHLRLAASGGGIVLTGVGGHVARALDVAGAATIFPIEGA